MKFWSIKMEIDFKSLDDCVSDRAILIQEAMRQAKDEKIYEFKSEDEKIMFDNYPTFRDQLKIYKINEEADGEDSSENIDILISILSFFNQMIYGNIKILFNFFCKDKLICKIIEIYLNLAEPDVLSLCLKIFCNFSYLTNVSEFCAYMPDLINKMIGSINSPSYISKDAGMALGNLILDNEFYTKMKEDEKCDEFYEEFKQLENETQDQLSNENVDNDIYLTFLQFLYALIIKHYDPSKLVNHIEYVTELLIRNRLPGSNLKDSEISRYSVRILKVALQKDEYFNEEQVQQVLTLFVKDSSIIGCLGFMIGEVENSICIKHIIESLIEYDRIDFAPIITQSVNIILRSSFSTPYKPRLNLLMLLYELIQNKKWFPEIDLSENPSLDEDPPNCLNVLHYDIIESFAIVANEGTFEEKKWSILIICEIGADTIDKFEDIFHILIDFISNDDREIVAPLLNLIRDLIYKRQHFCEFMISNEEYRSILHDFIFDPDISDINECKEIITSIDLLMQQIIAENEES